jgi:DNA-binding response OmpR family regulator
MDRPNEMPSTEKTINETILIIEDNFELRTYLKNILKSTYRVVTAPNGKQGLETALTILPDLIVSDVMMPQMDGFEVCNQLKNNILSSHIPIILLTALSDTDKKIGGYSSGADAYITKPFDEKILLAQIENLIRSRAKLREVFSVSDSEWVSGMAHLSSDRLLIEKAGFIVEQHLNDKNFIVDHLAVKLNISTSSLYRKLKTLTNQSPTEFVRYIRLKKAIKLMADGNSNVDEIGFAIGFNSHSYFTSSFKKQFGKTPSEYMHELKMKRP